MASYFKRFEGHYVYYGKNGKRLKRPRWVYKNKNLTKAEIAIDRARYRRMVKSGTAKKKRSYGKKKKTIGRHIRKTKSETRMTENEYGAYARKHGIVWYPKSVTDEQILADLVKRGALYY